MTTLKGASPAIWSYGNRNPHGLAVHPVTGEIYDVEHGPRGGDEVNKGIGRNRDVITGLDGALYVLLPKRISPITPAE